MIVLFTGGGGAGSGAWARLLASTDYEAHYVDADYDARPYGVDPQCWHALPLASDPAFVSEVRALCEWLGVEVLVPGVDEELLPLAQERGLLPLMLLPPTPFVATHLDKLTSGRMLTTVLGDDAPWTRKKRPPRHAKPPYVIKPRRGRGSRGLVLVWSAEEIDDYRYISPPGSYVVQEHLSGQEYTVTVAADADGNLRAIVPVRVTLKRGITIRGHTENNPEVIALCEKIHEACRPSGCYNVQCVLTSTGARPFEINPRISTTSCLALAAGVNVLDVYLGRTSGRLPFREGVELRRSWHNEFVG